MLAQKVEGGVLTLISLYYEFIGTYVSNSNYRKEEQEGFKEERRDTG
jgi:hypothetical protein